MGDESGKGNDMNELVTYKMTGDKVVIGIPNRLKHLKDAPLGNRRFRFRIGELASVVIRTDDGARRYWITDLGTAWGLIEQGRNVSQNRLDKYRETRP